MAVRPSVRRSTTWRRSTLRSRQHQLKRRREYGRKLVPWSRRGSPPPHEQASASTAAPRASRVG